MNGLLAIALCIFASTALAQQVSDDTFRPAIESPAFPSGMGPRLVVDQAHNNFHTLGGRFAPFGELARRDGYRVASGKSIFTAAVLKDLDLLVVSNAQWSTKAWAEYPTPTPSAFSEAEIAAVQAWVKDGGQLLLIADHIPLAGAAAKLATAFSVAFTDGYALRTQLDSKGQVAIAPNEPEIFEPGPGGLEDHPILRGRNERERVRRIRAFTGQAFQVMASDLKVSPLMVLGRNVVLYEPPPGASIDSSTKHRSAVGWLQGATVQIGRGRVAIFGEAAMFSAQVSGPTRIPMGMNAPLAEQNPQFVLNTLHWLSGLLDAGK
jgi:hypothetical protein